MSEALLKAVGIIGSRVRLANAIGTTTEVVKSWINSSILVPLEYALEIQRVTKGQVTWQEVSPHLAHFNFNKGWLSTNTLTSNNLPQLITQVSLSRIFVDPSLSVNIDEICTLSLDIQSHGLQRAICLDTENRLIFGKQRFYAYQMLSKKTIASWRLSLSGIIEGHYAVTELCKNFRWSERLAIALVIEKFIGNRQGQRSDLELRQNFVEVAAGMDMPIFKGLTKTLIANHLGFGNRETYAQSKKIYLNGSKALIEAVDIQHVSVSGALTLLNLSHAQQKQVVAWQKKAIKPLLHCIKRGKSLQHFNLVPLEECVQ